MLPLQLSIVVFFFSFSASEYTEHGSWNWVHWSSFAKLHVIDSMVKVGRKSYVVCMLLMEKEYNIKQRNRSFSLSNWKEVKLPSKVNSPCVSVASAFLLFILPLWKHMAQSQCGSCWTSTYCILRHKDWCLGHLYLYSDESFLSYGKWNALQLR